MRRNILGNILPKYLKECQVVISDVCLTHQMRYDWMVEASKIYYRVLAETLKDPVGKVLSLVDKVGPNISLLKETLDEEYVCAAYASILRPELKQHVGNFQFCYGYLRFILRERFGTTNFKCGWLENCPVRCLRRWLKFVHANEVVEYDGIDGLLETAKNVSTNENPLLVTPHLINSGMRAMRRKGFKPISAGFPVRREDGDNQDYMALRAWILWSHRDAIKKHNSQLCIRSHGDLSTAVPRHGDLSTAVPRQPTLARRPSI